jgi:hypothetical protein
MRLGRAYDLYNPVDRPSSEEGRSNCQQTRTGSDPPPHVTVADRSPSAADGSLCATAGATAALCQRAPRGRGRLWDHLDRSLERPPFPSCRRTGFRWPMARSRARIGRGLRFHSHAQIGMGGSRSGILPHVSALDHRRRGAPILIQPSQRRHCDPVGAPNTDLGRARIPCGDHPRERVGALTARSPRVVSAPHGIGLG